MSCYTCLKAKLEKELSWAANADAAFTDKGYTNWKDATVRFSAHKASSCHKEAVLKVTTLPASTPDVAMCLSSQHKKIAHIQKWPIHRRSSCFLFQIEF